MFLCKRVDKIFFIKLGGIIYICNMVINDININRYY